MRFPVVVITIELFTKDTNQYTLKTEGTCLLTPVKGGVKGKEVIVKDLCERTCQGFLLEARSFFSKMESK